ncbi:xanthine dehydrogenase family protein molybdopterin-binding subunit [Mangrovicoccus sp. HB161399]|uniref:xanthine dehydrogenase family protein molybdopterin-binding subunit n=1 Tax=Mangrovicoccus sp. HB161399 TaxID=2720392 RepID=UPI0015553AD6|nr:molybdopterin cofactor-binding domain-containing protein [Mangrovicoccus sp. HB161399]
MTLQTTRRGFLKAAGAGALVIGMGPKGLMAQGDDGGMLTPFVRVDPDGTVTAIVKHFEMGQGTTTGLTTLIAEEMGVPMEAMKAEFAPSDPEVYNNLFFGKFQGTGGSTAMANSWMQYRQAGAAAREMILQAAAQAWDEDPLALRLENGMVAGHGDPVGIGGFVAAAAAMEVPAEPRLKRPDEFVLIGQPGVKRKDTPAKIDGSAKFAMDVQLDNQLVAVIARPPRMGAVVSNFDDSGAKDIKGFAMAGTLANGAGVAVFAENTWAAIQARDAVAVEWDMSKAESRGSDEIKAELMAAVDAPAEYDAAGKPEDASGIEGAATVVEKTFYFPLLAHAPMEPLTCTIRPDADGGITLLDGAQMPTAPHIALSKILGLEMPQIRVETLYAGGSFGRRGNPAADYQVEAALAFALTDKSRPVKLVWTREDDIRGGWYRPAFAHRVRVGIDGDGNIVGWDHRIAGQPLMKGSLFEAVMVRDGVDLSSVEGIADTPYAIPGMYAGLTDTAKATSILWWRSVGNTHTAYVMETMMDQAAKAVGRDPLEFRLAHLPGDRPEQVRLAAVLKAAAEKAGWGSPAAGRSQGIAAHFSFGTYVAEVAEISGNAADGVKIEKVTAAVDCGLAVNPDVIKAQVEGGIGYGLGAIMRDEITLEGGEVVQSNFPDYEPLRITDIGRIEVEILASAEAPSGIGEPGLPPAGPALANAIAAAGELPVSLPMASNGVSFA